MDNNYIISHITNQHIIIHLIILCWFG